MALNIVLVLLYLIVIFYLGYKGWRETQTASDYMIAGREINPYVMAMSYGATFISTSAIVGFGGAAALFGFSVIWLTFLNIFVGIFIAFVFFGKRTRKMGRRLDAHTFPEILGMRFESRFIQGFSALVIFLFLPVYAAAVLIGISRFIEVSLHIPYWAGLLGFSVILALYVIWGGLKGVMYTDALQGTLMFVMMIILIAFTYSHLGGVGHAHQALTDMANLVPAKLKALGHMGWTASPKSGSPLWWIVYSTIVFGVGIGVLAQPQLSVRFMTVKNDASLNRAVLVGGIFILAMTGIAFTVGPLSNVLFFQKFGKISIAMAGGNIDKVIPLYISKIMPGWFATLFLLAMLAAAMSTLSSQYHVGGTSLGRDFYERGLGKTSGGEITATRFGVGLTILFTIMWGLFLPPSVIAIATAFFFGLCSSTFLPMYTAALFWKRVTRKGAITSMVGGFAVSFFWLLFVHKKEAAAIGLCKALTGKVTLLGYPWVVVDPNLIALPISIILIIIVSLMTPRMDDEHVEKCFDW